ncbi:MAG: energy transducer TonB [Deltaproteobacteria bacterium]|nr:energy transducer TonB [Deltaproteobacteria bacterium]
MKIRILISAIFAFAIHGILFSTDFKFLSQDIKMSPKTNVMQMSFASPREKPAESKTEKTNLKTKEIKHKKVSIYTQPDKDTKGFKNSITRESITVFHKAKPLDISNKPPSYPRIAQIRGYQGTVMLRVLVTTNGMVSKLNILKSSGYWILDKSALTAVKDWMFEPGTDGSKKVDMWVEQPIRFQLK